METNADQNSEDYIRTNEIVEIIDICKFVCSFTEKQSLGMSDWRWIIVGSAMAFQGACVCTLAGYDTTRTSVLDQKSETEWLSYFNNGMNGPAPKAEWLAAPKKLLERVQDKEYLPEPYTLKVDKGTADDIKTLIEFRNSFVHFLPQSWSIQTIGLPRIVESCWSAIQQLVVDQQTFGHHLSSDQVSTLAECIRLIRTHMKVRGLVS